MSHTVRVTVVSAEQYGGDDYPPETLLEFRDWLDKKIASIPAEHRANTQIEFRAENFYDSSYVNIEIKYWRQETKDEAQQRKNDEAHERAAFETGERRELEKLKAKYPDNSKP